MATPSPQQVGREFVRQYYTVLHEAPDALHRFYSSGSTFVHGGVDRPGLTEEPVTGQLEIDKKIKLLNFKDCHTKIRQVDSQLTIGNGVVVQVTGELSNNGEPMRRFMQTFVLAPQTPKKFYVHNDIFRYQDEVYQDNSDTESEDTQQTETKTSTDPGLNYYQQTETNEVAMTQAPSNALASSLSTSVTSSSSSTSSATVSTSPTSQQQVILQEPVSQTVELVEQETQLVNGHSNQAESVSQPEETPQPVVQVQETPVEPVKDKPVEVAAKVTTPATVKEDLKQEPVQTTENKVPTGHSWAKIISTGQSTSSSSNLEQPVFTGTNPQVYQGQTNAGSTNTHATNTQQKRVNGNFNNSSKSQQNKPRNQQQQTSSSSQQNQAQQQQQPVQQQPSQQKQSAEQQRADQMLDDEKRFGRYPDGQQVFVGNLNQDLSETELRSFF